MKIKEVREHSTEELKSMEKDLARQLWKARLDNHINQLDDTSQIPKLRQRIARVKTILAEREQQGNQNG